MATAGLNITAGVERQRILTRRILYSPTLMVASPLVCLISAVILSVPVDFLAGRFSIAYSTVTGQSRDLVLLLSVCPSMSASHFSFTYTLTILLPSAKYFVEAASLNLRL